MSKQKIPYGPIRNAASVVLPAFLIFWVPRWLGILTVKPGLEQLDTFLGALISILFGLTVGIAIVAIVYNAYLGTLQRKVDRCDQ